MHLQIVFVISEAGVRTESLHLNHLLICIIHHDKMVYKYVK